ncbi:MAG: DNA-processing protein DprA [Verrucomicrobiota bacterium]
MTEAEAYFALNLVPDVGPIRCRRLVERFGSAERALRASVGELRGVEGIGAELAANVADWERVGQPEEERRRAAEMGLTLLTLADETYPPLLREIYDAPLVLYVKGEVPARWRRGLAVVGSRLTTRYGVEMTHKLSYQIAYAGVPVVSGLARGIDTAAHKGALAAKGVTWAVIGCGLGHLYPPENEELADKIVAGGGLLMSEFPLDVRPDRRTFPRRNRIVSGLSFGVLVTEAGSGSGALITARQALEQGRSVFAMPGRIDNPSCKGCHELIKEGAALAEGAEDILAELEFLLPPAEVVEARPLPPDLSDAEKLVFESIGSEEAPLDLLIQKTGLPSAKVSSTLLRLEMKKLVRQLPGKHFVKTA